MPILEIRNGGYVQIDLFNRMLLNNMHKLQRAIETRNFSDLQLDDNNKEQSLAVEAKTILDNEDLIDNRESTSGVRQKVPVVNSFFPFSYTDNNDDDNSNLNEILLFSSMSEGSILDYEM